MKQRKSFEKGPQQQGHPYGVQPWGNFYMKQQPEIRTAGLGLMSSLTDDLLLNVLYLLSAADLTRLGLASKALYCFAHTLDLWKALALQELPEDFRWCGSWRETYLCHMAPGYKPGSHKPLAVEGFYSDLLHQPWFCANVELQERWLEVENVDRRAGVTPEQFRQQYELQNQPVVLTDKMRDWPAMHKWDRHYLAAALAGRPVIVGNMPWRFGAYLAYCDEGAAEDEMPLYMFDKAFASASPQLAGDYVVPDVFNEDLFEVLGEESRPDYRWLIVGPNRSGSSFHIDPNATCAWNAVVSGRKKWIMFPPSVTPPGVHPSPDGADVAAPISIIEWLVNFYDEARNSKHPPLETTVEAGEVIYVPRGWWHMVLNLEPFTVAVTQNFVSSAGLPAVLKFLKAGKKELVSGCCMEDRSGLHDRFMAALQQQRPDILADLQQKQLKQQQQRDAEHKLSLLFKHKSEQQNSPVVTEGAAVHEHVAAAAGHAGSGGFSFGFSLSDEPKPGTISSCDEVHPCNPQVGGQSAAAAAAAAGNGALGCGFSFGFSLPNGDSQQQMQQTGEHERQQQQKEKGTQQRHGKQQTPNGKRARSSKSAETVLKVAAVAATANGMASKRGRIMQ